MRSAISIYYKTLSYWSVAARFFKISRDLKAIPESNFYSKNEFDEDKD